MKEWHYADILQEKKIFNEKMHDSDKYGYFRWMCSLFVAVL